MICSNVSVTFRCFMIFPLDESRKLLGTEERMLVKFSNLSSIEKARTSWLSFIRVGMKALWHAWTWQKDVPTYFSRLIAGTQRSSEPSPRKSTAARQPRCRAWADVEETREFEEASVEAMRFDEVMWLVLR